jgi:hypothetical protein
MNSFRLPVIAAFAVAAGLISAPSDLRAQSQLKLDPCKGVTIDPANDFVQNFNNSCYALTLKSGQGNHEAGDPDATYDQVYYQVMPGYSLVVLGTFPNARFLSATVYDDHLAITSLMIDNAILPLSSGMTNPFEIGAVYQPGSTYGLTVSFGGQVGTVAPGCSTSDTTIDQNVLDASQIHSGLTWLGYPDLPAGFPVHETGANDAGLITIRKYVDISNSPAEVVIVRQLSNGCAITAKDAVNQNIVSVTQGDNSSWLHQSQIAAHQEFATSIEPDLCYPSDPQNSLRFFRSADYVPIANTGSNVDGNVSSSVMHDLLLGKTYIRVRFVMPTIPNIPCTTGQCSLTGNEDLRYMSLAFEGRHESSGDLTLGAVDDSSFITDASGNVTLIVSLGGKQPANVTAANGYTYFDLTHNLNYSSLSRLELRNLLPNASFDCSGANIPFFTMEYNPEGGFMGAYAPTVDFPTADEIPVIPVPPARTDSCSAVPPPPVNCSTGN